jgi:putative spermidine/putrescine transport system permease protein
MGRESVKRLFKKSEKTCQPFMINRVNILLWILCGLILLFLVAPLFVIFPISFTSSQYLEFPPRGFSLQWYTKFFETPEWVTSILNSFKIGIMTSFLSVLLGVPAALVLGRVKFKGKQFISSFILLPMISPVIITAIALFFYFSKMKLIGSIYSIVLAHTVLAVPVVVVTVSATLQRFDETLERAAMILGANRLRTFYKVTFPLIRSGIFTGALFAFIISFDEVVIALFLSTYISLTYPKHMFSSIRESIDPVIAAASTLLICFLLVILFLLEILRRREDRLRQ